MELTIKILLLIIFCFWIYGLICDMLKEVNFKSTMNFMFGNLTNANLTHSIVNLAGNFSNGFSAFVASSISTVVYFIPVLKYFFKFIFKAILTYFIFKTVFKNPRTVILGSVVGFILASFKHIYNIQGFGYYYNN
jgi:hypothetical protein